MHRRIKAAQQRGLWEYTRSLRANAIDRANAVGPFELPNNPEKIPRHLDCSNYESCLDFAASRNWGSFSCQGCRKTLHGRFVATHPMPRKEVVK